MELQPMPVMLKDVVVISPLCQIFVATRKFTRVMLSKPILMMKNEFSSYQSIATSVQLAATPLLFTPS